MSSGHSGTNSADRKNIELGMEGIENGPVSSTSKLSKQKEDTVVEHLQIEGMDCKLSSFSQPVLCTF